MKPCNKCPWVPGRPLSTFIEDKHRKAALAGAWFCCHVNMGTCFGAENYVRQEERNQAKIS